MGRHVGNYVRRARQISSQLIEAASTNRKPSRILEDEDDHKPDYKAPDPGFAKGVCRWGYVLAFNEVGLIVKLDDRTLGFLFLEGLAVAFSKSFQWGEAIRVKIVEVSPKGLQLALAAPKPR